MINRTLVLGDIHGSRIALQQVLSRCGYDPQGDRVIFLGDVADGWPETRQAVDLLLEMPHLIHLLGNHGSWAREWMNTGWRQPIWTSQGGWATIESYTGPGQSRYDLGLWKNVPDSHKEYFNNALYFYEDEERNDLYIHGGFDWERPLNKQDPDIFLWDRDLWAEAIRRQEPLSDYHRIYVGHTDIGAGGPYRYGNVWNLDTGCGWNGCLTIMDVDTEECWQSDLSRDLYPSYGGR